MCVYCRGLKTRISWMEPVEYKEVYFIITFTIKVFLCFVAVLFPRESEFIILVGICNARDSHENGTPSWSSFCYKSIEFRVRLHVIQSDIKVHCADLSLLYSAIPRILPLPVIHAAIQLWRHRPSPTRSHYTIMNSNRSCKLYLSRGNTVKLRK